MKMTRSLVADLCKKNGYYSTPELNEQLHLHFRGFERIENLNEFTNCRVLWLESNCIEKIENLEDLKELRCLYLQNNCVISLGETMLPSIESLNVNSNLLRDLDGLRYFPMLTTLRVGSNEIYDEALENLSLHCPLIATLDLSQNKLRSHEKIVNILKCMEKLLSVDLSGNELVGPNHRKKTISQLTQLKKLDDTPVFDDERRLAVAWLQGGVSAERQERKLIQTEKNEKNRQNSVWFDAFLSDARKAPQLQRPTIYRINNEAAALADASSSTSAAQSDANLNPEESDIYVPEKNIKGQLARTQSAAFEPVECGVFEHILGVESAIATNGTPLNKMKKMIHSLSAQNHVGIEMCEDTRHQYCYAERNPDSVDEGEKERNNEEAVKAAHKGFTYGIHSDPNTAC